MKIINKFNPKTKEVLTSKGLFVVNEFNEPSHKIPINSLKYFQEEYECNGIGKSNIITKMKCITDLQLTSKGKMINITNKVNELLTKDKSTREYSASIFKMPISLKTNSPHLANFFKENFHTTSHCNRHLDVIKIYAITKMKKASPSSFYNQELNALVIINTSYYAEIKKVLGAVNNYLDNHYNIHSIHGSCIEKNKKGVIFMGTSRMGKSTLAYSFVRKGGYLLADDWIFTKYLKDKIISYNSEKNFYLKTDIINKFPELKKQFLKSHLENAMIDPKTNKLTIGWNKTRAIINHVGKKVISKTHPCLVFVLHRDPLIHEDVIKLSESEFLNIVKKGNAQTNFKPFLNESLMVDWKKNKTAFIKQIEYFRKLYQKTTCYYLNTNRPFTRTYKIVDEIINQID